ADVLGDPLALARWWPSVYLDVQELRPPDARGVGRRVRLHTKGWPAVHADVGVRGRGVTISVRLHDRRQRRLRGRRRLDVRRERSVRRRRVRLAYPRREAAAAQPVVPAEANLRSEPPLGDGARRGEPGPGAGAPPRHDRYCPRQSPAASRSRDVRRRRARRGRGCPWAPHFDERAHSDSGDESLCGGRRGRGGIEQVKEQVREGRLGNWLRSVLSDCRYALRQLGKNPGFTAVGVLTLALGIGATTAIFSVVYGVLLRPLPYADPDRIVAVFEVTSKGRPTALADPNFDDFRDQNGSFQAIAKYGGAIATVSGASPPTRAVVGRVSADFLKVFGVQPIVGRGFVGADATKGA
ncbi:MAG: hypothetical protein DMG03_05955, partial [Acidobacteria bacterium]